jgi:hypothetical protein
MALLISRWPVCSNWQNARFAGSHVVVADEGQLLEAGALHVAGAHAGRGLASPGGGQLLEIDAGHVDVQIDVV